MAPNGDACLRVVMGTSRAAGSEGAGHANGSTADCVNGWTNGIIEGQKVTDRGLPAAPRNGLESRSTPGGTGNGGLSSTLRALKHRNFQLFFGGQLISVTGTWMQTVALSWLVYRLTGSSLLLGTAGFAGQIPVFLLAPLGGMMADRHDRQRIVIGTQTASMVLAFLLAALTLTGRVQVWHILVLAGSLGVANAFDIPARQAFLVDMVGREDLMNAIALNSSMFNGARIVGPAVAGILVAMIGEGWCFFANAVSYVAVIVGLMMMRVRRPSRKPPSGSPWTQIVEGFRFVGHTRPIRAILLLLGLISLVAMPYTVLMPVFADGVLHGGARGLGILMSATGVEPWRPRSRSPRGPACVDWAAGSRIRVVVSGPLWPCSRSRAASGSPPRFWCPWGSA